MTRTIPRLASASGDARPEGTGEAAAPEGAQPPAGAGITDAPHPDDPRLRAWVAFLQAHAALTRRLEAELRAERGLTLADYDALVQLAVADERRLRMSELADRTVLSRSGVSRLVDRLAADGLVVRRACPTDARGAWAELTPAGLDRLRHAAPVHLRGVERHFLAPLSDDEREALAGALETVLQHARTPEKPVPPPCDTIAVALEG